MADFKVIAAAALDQAEILLAEWIGGKRVGREWRGERRANGGPGDSWAVNLDSGQWLWGAGGAKGGDLVALYAALHHIDQLAALNAVAGMVGNLDRPVMRLPSRRPPATLPDDIPPDAPPIPPHKDHGKEVAWWRYECHMATARYDAPAESGRDKVFAMLTWRRGGWTWEGHPDPRPLYGTEFLRGDPDAPVLIVEGEKCADAARAVLTGYVVVTWSGGGSSVAKTDWTPCTGRRIMIWPDADEPGRKAGVTLSQILAKLEPAALKLIDPTGMPEGWDIGDAIEDGWDEDKILEWMRPRAKTLIPRTNGHDPSETPPELKSEVVAKVEPRRIEVQEPQSAVVWNTEVLDCNQAEVPHATSANVSLIVQMHPKFAGKIWLDTFRGKAYTSLGLESGEREYEDYDDLAITHYIQHTLGLNKFNSKLVFEGVRHAAWINRRNSLTDWLDHLEWDGTERLDTWLADCLGAERNEYNDAVARNWAIAMVARAYDPGCQMDNMVILEGKMGLRKSSFLKMLGGPWYKSLSSNFGEKSFLESIVGAWLIEIPDMSGFKFSDHSRVLATITIRSDEWRKSYGHHSKSHQRTCVFACTSESNDYIGERRGIRRYWPIQCKDIQTDSLVQQRDQIFAEAKIKYRAGASWYEMPDSALEEQLDRADDDDVWTESIMGYVLSIWDDRTMPEITTPQILRNALEIERGKQTDKDAKRLVRIMKAHGWRLHRFSDRRVWRKTLAERIASSREADD